MRASSTLRVLAVLLVGYATTRGLWWLAAGPVSDLGSAGGAWGLDRLVVDGAAVAGVLSWAALVLTTAVSLLSGLLPRRAQVRIPRVIHCWRRAVLAVCGLGIAAPVAAAPLAAVATEGSRPPSAPVVGRSHCPRLCAERLVGLPVPDLPAPGVFDPALYDRSARPPVQRVTVQPGDSLWLIATRQHPGAGDAIVARDVDRWYHRNRQRIGPDPDLIFPGTVLIAPRR